MRYTDRKPILTVSTYDGDEEGGPVSQVRENRSGLHVQVDEPVVDPVRPFVAERIKRDGWGAIQAINWAKDRDIVEKFRAVVMFTRLCADPIARIEPAHLELHRAYGIRGCVGDNLLAVTRKALGISQQRARFLIDQMDNEHRMVAGLKGE